MDSDTKFDRCVSEREIEIVERTLKNALDRQQDRHQLEMARISDERVSAVVVFYLGVAMGAALYNLWYHATNLPHFRGR